MLPCATKVNTRLNHRKKHLCTHRRKKTTSFTDTLPARRGTVDSRRRKHLRRKKHSCLQLTLLSVSTSTPLGPCATESTDSRRRKHLRRRKHSSLLRLTPLPVSGRFCVSNGCFVRRWSTNTPLRYESQHSSKKHLFTHRRKYRRLLTPYWRGGAPSQKTPSRFAQNTCVAKNTPPCCK